MPTLLLRVAATWPLPGLGLLVLPAGPTPHLLPYALHTTLAVIVSGPNGEQYPGSATVEEITQPNATHAPLRGLLLDLSIRVVVLPGAKIWLHDSE
ncbi:hypothetical protein [Hymenobacter negativus]|uniref:Secreted protein n=1 Tax=Hymenobacter negativus TaxID=2795026 RepID=A0ABS3QH74_9BACT|nr:hypothetical protein [Hymenobacter negativus]MBO2010603.1 hypothetical protein [Hymenobacter negativus]